jgi:hypothetical protein
MGKEEIRDLNERTLSLLTLPDGRPYMPRRLWNEIVARSQELVFLCGRSQSEGILTLLPRLKEKWRQLQDRDADHSFSLVNEFRVRFGEEAMEELWEYTYLRGLFEMRYAKFDISQFPWEEALHTNLYLVFEAMRGHLAGPNREGDTDFWEENDRYGFRFDPCGIGGPFFRGSVVEGTPPRYKAPYNWGTIEKELDIGWNQKGICPYCTHCNAVMQRKPIQSFGYPVRVVEPPYHHPAGSKTSCEWYVYKDPRQTPEEYYRSVGLEKPDVFGSRGDR